MHRPSRSSGRAVAVHRRAFPNAMACTIMPDHVHLIAFERSAENGRSKLRAVLSGVRRSRDGETLLWEPSPMPSVIPDLGCVPMISRRTSSYRVRGSPHVITPMCRPTPLSACSGRRFLRPQHRRRSPPFRWSEFSSRPVRPCVPLHCRRSGDPQRGLFSWISRWPAGGRIHRPSPPHAGPRPGRSADMLARADPFLTQPGSVSATSAFGAPPAPIHAEWPQSGQSNAMGVSS